MSHDDDFDYRTAYGGRYLTAVEIPEAGDDFTITGARIVEVEDPKTKAMKKRLEVGLQGLPKTWLPARTASGSIAAMFGDRVAAWTGRRVTLHCDPRVKVGGKVVGGIRVLGSPELREPMSIEVDLGSRKPPAKVTLRPTSRGAAPARSAAPAAAPSPGPGPAPTLADLGLTLAGVDALLQEKGRPPATDATLPAILTRLAHPDSAAALARARELSRPAADDAANTLPELE